VIIQEKTGSVYRCGVVTEVACTIAPEDMPHISHLLRDNYSDAKWATVREIIANAIDANEENNVKRSPLITLPSSWKAEFSVRDFGKGLSHEDIFGLYSQYGKSTKRGSNAGIGGFGIGRFAPLSYTGSFMVESYYNGTVNVYSVFIDETNDTKISLMNSENTSEPNGIRIVVGVDPSDINLFRDHILKLDFYGDFRLTDVKGKLLRDIYKEEYPIEEVIYSGKGWQAVRGKNLNKNIISMGGIPYPIDINHLALDKKIQKFIGNFWSGCSGYSYYNHNNGALHWIIEADVGAVSMHHSREALEYNSETVEYLKTRIKEIYSEFYDQLISKINKASSYAEACGFFGDLIDEVGANSFEECFETPQYNGKTLMWRYSLPYHSACRFYMPDISKASNYSSHKKSRYTSTWPLKSEHAFLLRDDEEKTVIPKVRYLCEEKGFSTVCVVGDEDINYLKKNNHLDEFSDFVFYTSTCESKKAKIVRGKRVKGVVLPYTVKVMDLNGYGRSITNYPSVQSDSLSATDTLYYIPIIRSSFSDDKFTEEHPVVAFNTLRQMAELAGVIIDKVYFIPKSSASRFNKDASHKWENFFDAVGLALQKKFDQKQIDSYSNCPFYREDSYQKSALHYLHKNQDKLTDSKMVSEINAIHDELTEYFKKEKAGDQSDLIKQYAIIIKRFSGTQIVISHTDHDVGDLMEDFQKKYLTALYELTYYKVLERNSSKKSCELLVKILNQKIG